MHTWMIRGALLAMFGMLLVGLVSPAAAGDAQLAHMVYFKLKDNTDANRQKVVDLSTKYLSGHEGMLYFSVGVLAEELDREVNDRQFDVALHMVFKDKASHDKYQVHPRHVKYVEQIRPLVEKVRVFDSYVVADGEKK